MAKESKLERYLEMARAKHAEADQMTDKEAADLTRYLARSYEHLATLERKKASWVFRQRRE